MIDRQLAILCRDAYNNYTWETEGDTQALLRMFGEIAVVAFRGTEASKFCLEDLARDLRACPWWDADLGWCHAGFLKGAREIWPEIRELAMRPGLPVILTGHSLGGALASITAGFMVAAGKRPTALVTFGEPRPGFPKLAELIGRVPGARYRHGADGIPSHPWPIWGYRHRKPETWITGGRLGEPDRLRDHDISAYIEALGIT